jgi:hypothetical protein
MGPKPEPNKYAALSSGLGFNFDRNAEGFLLSADQYMAPAMLNINKKTKTGNKTVIICFVQKSSDVKQPENKTSKLKFCQVQY